MFVIGLVESQKENIQTTLIKLLVKIVKKGCIYQMSIKQAERDLWKEIINNVDFANEKKVQKAINKLKEECKRKWSYQNKKE